MFTKLINWLDDAIFASWEINDSRKVSDDDNHTFQILLDQYARTRAGKWLRKLPYHRYQINWCNEMTMNSGVMGAFIPRKGNNVYLMPSGTPECDKLYKKFSKYHIDSWVLLIFPTLIHELRHAYQLHNNRALYVLCCIPGIRQLTLEPPAWLATRKAEQFIRQVDMQLCANRLSDKGP